MHAVTTVDISIFLDDIRWMAPLISAILYLFIPLFCSKNFTAAWCEFSIDKHYFYKTEPDWSHNYPRRDDSPPFTLSICECASRSSCEVDGAGASGVAPLSGKGEPSPPGHSLVLFHVGSERQGGMKPHPACLSPHRKGASYYHSSLKGQEQRQEQKIVGLYTQENNKGSPLGKPGQTRLVRMKHFSCYNRPRGPKSSKELVQSQLPCQLGEKL